ncbi:MAG: hypothetical protein EPN93_06465 [Spirochaetes bacterium]|nr:MAG: hypothetical protein EPN93_06465 [Spirochaetota bacterium]
MIYNGDWEKTKGRFQAFWECDMLDRCCISVTAPRAEPLPTSIELKEPRDLVQQWTDPELALRTYEFAFCYGYLGGDALPVTSPYLGPGVVAALLGADYTLQPDTVWFGKVPVLADWASRAPLALDREHPLWKALMDMTARYAEHAPGRHVVGMTDLGGCFDIAVSLRGTQELIYDLIDCPEEVVRLGEEIDTAWMQGFDELYKIIARGGAGMTAWIPLYLEGRWYPLQCDFSANLSPALFDRYVMPSIEREARALDRAIYHLDGPDAVKYIDSILDIGKIHGIQWVPGDTGVPESSVAHDKWFPLYEKIQRRGKCLVLLDVNPREIEKILGRVSAKGVFMTTRCDSQQEADDLLALVGKWSRP